MKTLKNITLTAVLIILTANVTMANNYRIHRILTSAGKVIEVISIIEMPVKEIIPGYESFVSEIRNNNDIDVYDIEIYVENEADDYNSFFTSNNRIENSDTYAETADFVRSIYVEEETVNDFSFDTKKIFKENLARK